MKRFRLRGLCLGVMLITGAAAQVTPGQEYRDFTGSNGVVIKAVLIDKSDTEAILLTRDGKRANVQLANLGE
ncbi:MAG: hypothetical protein NTV46_11300, partial [Verrucomicrobia bacterium]|nr:hypothetical protein [Verrucomicrobiota bacterium]